MKELLIEEKELLLKDLCGRLSHGVMLKHISTEKIFKLFSIKRNEYTSYKKDGVELAVNGIYYDWFINDTYHDIELYIKPYLRPMSSMTEEEKEEFDEITLIHTPWGIQIDRISKLLDWLNSHHFDYRGLIEKGLAIAVTEENNPYKE